MNQFVIVFIVGFVIGTLISTLIIRKILYTRYEKKVIEKCELHQRFPKTWSSGMIEYYYRNQAEQMLKFIDYRRTTYPNRARGSAAPTETDWIGLFRLFRNCNSLGMVVKLECISEDGEDLEKDPEMAEIEIQKMRNRLWPDMHEGFRF